MTDDDIAEQKATERWEKFADESAAQWFKKYHSQLYQTIADAEFMNGDSGEVLTDLGSLLGQALQGAPGTLLLSNAIKKQKQEY